jgi:hypothetical protein
MPDAERWTKKIKLGNETFVATFTRRPFREGLQASVDVHGTRVELGELGLGEQALIERLTAEIERIRKKAG